MQVSKFSNGGYVAHKVFFWGLSPMKFSVWFSAGGDVVDIAAYDKRGRAARVPNVIRERAARIYPEVVARAA
jgi:hypothetical protein